MPFEAIVGVVEDFPWFGAAQRALCERMTRMGGKEIARDIYAVAALHVPSRRKILCVGKAEPFSGGRTVSMPEENPVVAEEISKSSAVNKNYRGAGDYFSREQYEQVKEVSETTTTAGDISNTDSFNFDKDVSLDGFCTEALAEIYAEQGYFERAKDIYAKLILAEPEKNTYFASLIEKMNEKKLKI